MWQHHIPQNIIKHCLADSRLIYFWQVLEYIHKFIIELYVLQCLFVRGSNKKQRRGRFSSNFISYLVIILSCAPPSCTLSKKSFFPVQLGQEEIISGNLIERRIYGFILKIDGVLSVSTYRVGIGWWTLLYNAANISPICR